MKCHLRQYGVIQRPGKVVNIQGLGMYYIPVGNGLAGCAQGLQVAYKPGKVTLASGSTAEGVGP